MCDIVVDIVLERYIACMFNFRYGNVRYISYENFLY